MRPPSCLKSPDQPCAGLFCTQDRTYLGLRIQKDGNEEVTEAFCVCSWTPEQLGALRVFVNAGAGSSPAFAEDLKRISNRPSRVFHLLHSMFGPEGIKRLYAKDTNRKYRQQLHRAGFDYPERPVPQDHQRSLDGAGEASAFSFPGERLRLAHGYSRSSWNFKQISE